MYMYLSTKFQKVCVVESFRVGNPGILSTVKATGGVQMHLKTKTVVKLFGMVRSTTSPQDQKIKAIHLARSGNY